MYMYNKTIAFTAITISVKRGGGEVDMGNRPTEIIIVSVSMFLYAIWQLDGFLSFGGPMLSIILAGAAIYAGIGLLRQSRVSYITSIVLAGLVLFFMVLGIAIPLLQYYISGVPPRAAFADIERNIIWSVLSIFVLYCLRTPRTKQYFSNTK